MLNFFFWPIIGNFKRKKSKKAFLLMNKEEINISFRYFKNYPAMQCMKCFKLPQVKYCLWYIINTVMKKTCSGRCVKKKKNSKMELFYLNSFIEFSHAVSSARAHSAIHCTQMWSGSNLKFQQLYTHLWVKMIRNIIKTTKKEQCTQTEQKLRLMVSRRHMK